MFLQLFVIVATLAASCRGPSFGAARPALAHLRSTAAVVAMAALHLDLTFYVWPAFDVAPLFSDHDGATRASYMGASASAAGWVLLIVLDLVWLVAVLPAQLPSSEQQGAGGSRKQRDVAAPPITGSVATEGVRLHVRA